MNVDQAELEKFNELANRWWDPAGEFAPLHRINPLRLGWIESATPLAGKRVVDIGCGGGILAEAMAGRGASVLGIDLADKPLKVAELHRLETGPTLTSPLDYRKVAAEDLAAEQPGSFDIVTCMEMLEHVPDPAATVRACATLVKPGGKLFFSTINRNPKSYLFAVIGAEYLLRLLPRGTHDYGKFIKPSELAGYLRDAGLELGAVSGMGYNPLTRVYSLGPDISVNYLMSATRP